MIYDCFRAVLRELNDRGRQQYGDQWEPKVAEALEYLEGAYKNLRDTTRELIDYAELPTQAAYMFIYAVGRAEFTFQILRAFRNALDKPIFARPDISIAAIGGGPASELPGLVKYLQRSASGEPVKTLQFDVFDKEPAWKSVSSLVAGNLPAAMIKKAKHHSLDLGDSVACSTVDLSDHDAVILSFVVSEICAVPNTTQIKSNLATVLRTMRPGVPVIYNDSNAYSFYTCMNSVRGLSKLTEILEVDATIEIDSPDLSGDFAEMIDKYGRTPHLNSKAVAKYLVKN